MPDDFGFAVTETPSPSSPTSPYEHDAEALRVPQIQLNPADTEKVVGWMVGEIERSQMSRADLEEQLAEWDRLYEATPREKVKTIPWPNCANLVVPIIGTSVDAIVARLLLSVFGGKQLWLGTARSANWTDLADPITNWLNWVGTEVMKMYRVSQKWFISTVKYGTGILKLPWERRVKRVVWAEGDGSGGLTEEFVITHDGPAPKNVFLGDFFFSNDAITTGDIQNCQWVAERTHMTWKQLKEYETSQIFYDVDRIKDFKRSQPTRQEEQTLEATKLEIQEYDDFELFDVYCSYDLKEDGIPVELILTIEKESGIALRAVYNFYRHQERPFHLIRLMPRDNSILGIGVCQMLEMIQEEVSTIHNQGLDNATIANTKVFTRVRDANIFIDDIYPGCIIDIGEKDDFDAIDMGETYSSRLSEELHTTSIGEKRTGVSDYTVGRESAAIGSRATATSTLALIREGNKRFQMTIKDIREAFSDIAQQVIMLYQQFAKDQTVMYEMFSEKDRQLVGQFFQLPIEFSRANIIIDTPTISEVENKEIVQQTMLTLMGVMFKFYESIIQAVMLTVQPNVPDQVKQLGAQGAKDGVWLWKRVLEAFDIKDVDSHVPDIEAILGLQAFSEGAYDVGGAGSVGPENQNQSGPAPGQNPNVGAGDVEGLLAGIMQGAGQQMPAGNQGTAQP